MAGDWIKLEHTTPDKPEVVLMASLLRIDQDAVVGKLVRVWVWADQNSVDGVDMPVTDAFIDRLANKKGFAAAMRKANWLHGEDSALTFTEFGRHNGSTAKARADSNRRMAKSRAGRDADSAQPKAQLGHTNVAEYPQQKPQPEKRREEYNPPLAPKGASGGKKIGPQDDGGTPLTIRQVYPEPLASSSDFITCWESEWLPYLLDRKGGRMPTIMTTERQLGICLKLGPARAIAGLRSAIEKEWASPDERAQVRGTGNMLGERPWDTAPDDWKAYWRNTYPPEDYPDAPRHEDEEWKDLTNDRRKLIWEGVQKEQQQRRAG